MINTDEEFTSTDQENGIRINPISMKSFVSDMPYLNLLHWKQSKYNNSTYRYDLTHVCFARTQIAGVTTIADAEGFGFHQLRNFTLDHARNAASFVQDSFPLWFRSIHVINAPRLFFIVSVIEQFITPWYKSTLFVF